MAAGDAHSRRRPYPYDAYLDTVRVMLVAGDDGELVAQKSRTLGESAPSSYEYGSSNPNKERTTIVANLHGGLGQNEEPDDGKTRRYRSARNVDTSINGTWIKGPHFETETIHPAAGDVRGFVRALGEGGVERVHAICQYGVFAFVPDGGTPTPLVPLADYPGIPGRGEGSYTGWDAPTLDLARRWLDNNRGWRLDGSVLGYVWFGPTYVPPTPSPAAGEGVPGKGTPRDTWTPATLAAADIWEAANPGFLLDGSATGYRWIGLTLTPQAHVAVAGIDGIPGRGFDPSTWNATTIESVRRWELVNRGWVADGSALGYLWTGIPSFVGADLVRPLHVAIDGIPGVPGQGTSRTSWTALTRERAARWEALNPGWRLTGNLTPEGYLWQPTYQAPHVAIFGDRGIPGAGYLTVRWGATTVEFARRWRDLNSGYLLDGTPLGYRWIGFARWEAQLAVSTVLNGQGAPTSPVLPAGVELNAAMRFRHRGAAPVDALYVTTTAGAMYRQVSGTWATHANAAGPGLGTDPTEARYVTRTADEFWIAGDYWVVKVEDDPFVRANYSGVIWIGDRTSTITWITSLEDKLFVFKADGSVYTVSDEGIPKELFPYLRGARDARSGKNAAPWIDELWVPFGGHSYRLKADGTLIPDGIEQILDVPAAIKGELIAAAGHNTWFMYEVYHDAQANESHLVKHGTWYERESNDEDAGGPTAFRAAHHGALATWNWKATSAAIVQPQSGTEPDNDALFIGFAAGVVARAILPKDSPNPVNDPRCQFTEQEAYIDLASHHGGFRADVKLFRGVSLFGQVIDAYRYLTLAYRQAGQVDYQALVVSLSTLSSLITAAGQRIEINPATPIWGTTLDLRIYLWSNDRTITPVVNGLGIHEQLRPKFSVEYAMGIDASGYIARHDGTTERRTGRMTKEAVRALAAREVPLPITLPDGSEEYMTIVDYKEALRARRKNRDLGWLLQITAVQLRNES